MYPLNVALAMFGSMLFGSLAGKLAQRWLPDHHFSNPTKRAVRLTAGLIVTLSALVISLMVSSAKTSFDAKRSELNEISANLVLLDRTLALYGPETQPIRDRLRREVAARIAKLWPEEAGRIPEEFRNTDPVNLEGVEAEVVALVPRNDAQRQFKSDALQVNWSLAHARWILDVQTHEPSVPKAFLFVLAFWLMFVFAAFSFQSTWNSTVAAAYAFSALAVSCSVYLILELDSAYYGLIRLSSSPMFEALSRLGK